VCGGGGREERERERERERLTSKRVRGRNTLLLPLYLASRPFPVSLLPPLRGHAQSPALTMHLQKQNPTECFLHTLVTFSYILFPFAICKKSFPLPSWECSVLVSIRVDDSTSPPLPSPPQTHHLPPFLFSLSLSLSQRGRGGEGVRGEREGQRRRGEGEEGEVRQNSATDMDLGLRIAPTRESSRSLLTL
jgi:hypothetical protein